MSECEAHPGDSAIQRGAEKVIREQLGLELGVSLDPAKRIERLKGLCPDGFCDGPEPICVEIWAHQGCAKSAQKAKVMKDMCKLLLCERLLARKCRKIVVVSDDAALSFLRKSWEGQFAKEFGIELRCVDIPQAVREQIQGAQRRQFR